MDTEQLIERLREANLGLAYNGIENGCVNCGLASSLATAAADALEASTRREREMREVGRKLLANFDGFMTCNDGFMGNQADAYYRLVKNSFDEWEALRTTLSQEGS